MKLIIPVAARWYGRLNEVSIVLSILVLSGYLALEILFTKLSQDLPITISILSAVFAVLALIYGIVGYHFAARKSSLLAGLLSYTLLSLEIGSLVWLTGGLSSQYVLLWVIVLLFSAMFGWLVMSITWIITHVYFILLALEIIGHSLDPGILTANLIVIELPFLVSFFLWYGQGLTSNSSDELDEDVGTDDISQGMLISSIAEGVAVVDDQYRIQVFNPAATEITGWKEQDAKGIDYKSVLTLTDNKGNQISSDQDPIMQVFSKKETVLNNDIYLETRNNKQIELTFVASPITSKTGSVVAVVAVFRDVSEERHQERQRAEFISTASHEMRTPVAAIEGYLALAMNENVTKIDSKAREYLNKAHTSTQHLGKLFQDLLTAAKSEDGRLVINPSVIEIGTLLDEIVEEIKIPAQTKGLVLEYQSSTSDNSVTGAQTIRPLYYARIDPERMREVITNLFDNAIKYTSEGKIIVDLSADGNNIIISISDTGPGIPQEDIPHLFQKFYRVDNTTTRQVGGTGLGLFISRKIVELNNGKIWVESEVDKGSSFKISLPRLTADEAQKLIREETAKESPLAHVTGNIEL